MASLMEGEQELVRERQKLQIAREDLARRETALENEKAILAEQIAALSEARQSWNHAELHNLNELETLTRALKAREHAADERDRQAIIHERRRQDQEQELIQLREKMEAWQNALLEHEHAARQAREQANADLEARKSQILNWEQSVEQIIRSWNELREQERTQLRTELDRWTIARQRYEVALTQLDDTRERYLEETRNAAALALSLEEANPTAGPKADRRMRVLRKKWEKHFDRFRNELDKRRAECAADSEEAAERIAELHQMLMQCDEVYAMQHLKQLQRDREFVTSLIHAGESPAPSMLDATVLEQSENARLPDGTRRAA
jgi:chromosome segregation ATPase